jgi:outer membrane protein OmpA-like peptidoglycan-associated protein
MRQFILFAVLLLAATTLLAQPSRKPPGRPPAEYGTKSKKAAAAYEQALIAQGYRDYREVLDHTSRATEADPDFFLAWFKQAEAYYNMRQIAQMRTPLARAEALYAFEPNQKFATHLHFYLGQLHMATGDYPRAVAAYETYLKAKQQLSMFTRAAQSDLVKARFSATALQHPLQFLPRNLGPSINTKGEEYKVSLTADDQVMFFTSRREGNIGGYSSMEQDFDEDFYVTRRQADSSWSPAENLGPPINTTGNEGLACILPDFQFVIYVNCSRQDSKGGCDLYVSVLNGQTWSPGYNLGEVINSRYYDSHPALSQDGRTLLFVSNRPGGFGGTDIWESRLVNGVWSAPRNLGATINTPGDEYSPFLHADDRTLYFSSDGHPGFGEQDLFLSKRQNSFADSTSQWSTPMNLGAPLNTPGREMTLFVTARGDHGYFNTTAGRGYGKNDIWEFELDPRIRPSPATFVRGIVTDSSTGKPVGRASVVFVRLSEPAADTVRGVRSNQATGRFLLSLPLEQNYAAYVEAPGYLFHSQNFSLKGLANQPFYELAIRLQPIREGATVTLNNIFFAYDQATLLPESQVELARILRFLRDNPRTRIELRGHTDAKGTPAYNLKLSQDRAAAVRDFLVTNGIPTTRLVARGYGETLPVAPNTSDEGRALNRRTEFRILSTK